MVISSKLIEANKTVCDVVIGDQFNPDDILQTRHIVSEDGLHVDVNCKILHMSGLFIMDTCLNIFKPVTDEFIVSGDHIRITMFFNGNSRVWEHSKSDFYDLQGGILRRKAENGLTHWNIAMIPDKEVNYVAIFMSKAYVMELIKNEHWIQHDQFISTLMHADEYLSDEEHYFIGLPIKQVLYELFTLTHEDLNRRYYLELKLKEMLFLLYTQQNVSSSAIGLAPILHDKIVNAKAFLLSNLDKPPTIKQLARIVGINELKLKESFKMMYGTTIHAYVIQKRMEKAKDLLLQSGSVNDMSAMLGYRSVSHFIGTFKKYYGETPKQALYKILRTSQAMMFFSICNELEVIVCEFI